MQWTTRLLALVTASLSACAGATLPMATTNNAVAMVKTDVDTYLVSFAGLGDGKTHDDVHARVFQRRGSNQALTDAGQLPDKIGRLASVAIGVGPLAYVLGGYTVADDGAEVSTPAVWSYDPIAKSFQALAPMPIPVDDAVVVSYQDRYLYLVSGWHDLANVNLVQRYDIETNTWVQATPWPGESVFGHAGGIVGDTMVICDGVTVQVAEAGPRQFALTDACFRGVIRSDDARRIDWHRLPSHPGPALYRMAATGSTAMNAIVFAGGSSNAYNYNGIGYDGNPSAPSGQVFWYDVAADSWQQSPLAVTPTMDHRGLIETSDGVFSVIGGMRASQVVSDTVVAFSLENP